MTSTDSLLVPLADPDLEATSREYIDYMEYLPSDISRYLARIRNLNEQHDTSCAELDEHLQGFAKLQRARNAPKSSSSGEERPATPINSHFPNSVNGFEDVMTSVTDKELELRLLISQCLNLATHSAKESATEAVRLQEHLERHHSRIVAIREKLDMVNLPSRDPTPEDKRSKTKRDDTRMRITLRLNNVDSATSLRALNSSRRRGGNRPSARRVVVAPVPSAKPKVEEEESWEDVQETPLSGGRPKKLKKGTTTVKKVPKISPPEPTVVGGAPSKFPDGTDIPSEQLPWNQLTVDELARLRKRMKKNTSWTPSVTMIVRELENLGRGPNNKHKFRTQWDGLEEQIFLGPEEGGIGDPQKLVADDGIGVRENKERDYSPITESAAAAESAAREKEEQKAAEKAAVAAAAAAAAAEEKERQENEERQKAAAAAAAAAEEKARAEAEAKAAEVKAAEVKAAEAEAAKEKEEKERQEKLAKETAEKAAQEKTTKPSPDKAAAKESPTKSKQEETPITKGSSKENLTSSPMKQQSGPTNVPSTLPLVESDDDLSDVPDVPALPALSDDVPSTTITTRFQRTQTKHNSTRPASHPPPPPKPEKRTRATSTLPLTPLVSRAKRKAQAASSPLPMSVPTGNKRSMSATVQKSKSSSRKTTGGSARKPGKKKRAAPTTTASAGGGGETEEDEEDLNTYCMCDEVSRGFMVACENDDCPKQWFHITCVGLKLEQAEQPELKWYCPICIVDQPGRRSGKRRRKT